VPDQAPEWAAELILAPAAAVIPLPDGVAFDDAAVEEPFHTALNGRELLGYREGDTVLIVGTGSMGWGQIQVARLTGATVIGVDLLPERLEMARRFGAAYTLLANAPDLEQRLGELCPEGVEFVIEATGLGKGLQLAIDLAGEGARIGTLGAREPVVTHSVVTKQMALIGIRNGYQKRQALELIAAGKLDFKPAISHRYPFERAPEALAHAAEKPGEVTKCVLEFQ
jgi:L-gulonate 5-dehydrogenase